MMNGMSGMMAGMGLVWLFALIVLVLLFAAPAKYLWRGRTAELLKTGQ